MRHPSSSTENSFLKVSRVPQHDVTLNAVTSSEDDTCWKRCRKLFYRKTRNSKLILSEKEHEDLSGEYEYIVEKLNIVKIPFLTCATQEDVKERLRQIATRVKIDPSVKIASSKSQLKISDPQIHKRSSNINYPSDVSDYSVSTILFPSFSEISSQSSSLDDTRISNLQGDSLRSSLCEEETKNIQATMKICLSKETVSSSYAFIPRPSKDTTERVSKEINLISKYTRDELESPAPAEKRNQPKNLPTLRTTRDQQQVYSMSNCTRDKRENHLSIDFENSSPKKLPGYENTQLVTTQQETKEDLNQQMFHPDRLTVAHMRLSHSDKTSKPRTIEDSKNASVPSSNEISEKRNPNILSKGVHAISRTQGFESSDSRATPTQLQSFLAPSLEYKRLKRHSNKSRFDTRWHDLEYESKLAQSTQAGHSGSSDSQLFLRTPSYKDDEQFQSRYSSHKQTNHTAIQLSTSGAAAPLATTQQMEMRNQIDTNEHKSSISEKSIFSKKHIKNLAYSRNFDVLLEEDKPCVTENTLHESSYVDVSSGSVPKVKVHEILNKNSSMFIDKLNDLISNDTKRSNTMKQKETVRPPSQAQVLSNAPHNQPPSIYVPSQTKRHQSSCNQRQSFRYDPHHPSNYVNYARCSSNNNYPTQISVNVEKTKVREPKRKNSDPKKTREILKPKTVRCIIDGHSYTSKQMFSGSKRRNSSQIRNITHDHHDNEYLELRDLHLLSNKEHTTSDTIVQENYHGHEKHAYYGRSGGKEIFDSTRFTNSVTSNDNIPEHSPVSSRQTHTKHIMKFDGEKSHQYPRPEDVSREGNSSNSDSQNTRIFKRWKITIKNHNGSESDCSNASEDTNRERNLTRVYL